MTNSDLDRLLELKSQAGEPADTEAEWEKWGDEYDSLKFKLEHELGYVHTLESELMNEAQQVKQLQEKIHKMIKDDSNEKCPLCDGLIIADKFNHVLFCTGMKHQWVNDDKVKQLQEQYETYFNLFHDLKQKLEKIREWYGRAQGSVTHEEALEMKSILEEK